MVSFLGNNYTGETTLFNALSKTTGIGRSYATFLCRYLGLAEKATLNEVPRLALKELHRTVLQSRLTGPLLRRLVLNNIRRKIELKSYQGRRHLEGLPVRGQNSKANARTARMLRKSKNSFIGL